MKQKVSASIPKDTVANDRRQELIDAAASLFATKGFGATTMRDIAAHVGKTPGALYYHFTSKDELLVAVHSHAHQWAERTFTEIDNSAEDPWLRLEKICIVHLEALLERPDYAIVVAGILPSDDKKLRRQVVAVRDEWERRFRELIDELPLKSEDDRKVAGRAAIAGA
jgi:AcrR family transcriptional regulator